MPWAVDSPTLLVVQVKDMEQGTEELVAISELPSHVAKLVEDLGKRTLVATKRQAPASEQTPAAAPSQQAGVNQQSTSSRQTPASSSQQDSSQKGQDAQQAKQARQGKQGAKVGSSAGGVQDGGLASLADSVEQGGDSGVIQQATQSLSVAELAKQCDRA